jgi:hypothetical protein
MMACYGQLRSEFPSAMSQRWLNRLLLVYATHGWYVAVEYSKGSMSDE